MYINLSDLTEVGSKKSVLLDVEFQDLEFVDREIEIKDPVNLDLEIFNTRESFAVKGILKAELILSCSRCLDKYTSQVELEISEEVLKSKMEDEEELYLDEIIKDNIILSLPMKTLCSKDCQGICPQCGQNLNEEECDCETETVDPRLAKLKDFYENTDNK